MAPVSGRARRWLGAAVALACLACAGRASADASLPYSPSWAARHELARLADEAGLRLTLSQWPLPAGAVRSALQALPTDLSSGLAAARDAVLADLDRAERPLLTLRAKTRRDAAVGYDDDDVPGSSASLRSGSMLSPGAFALGLGVRVEQPAGSMLEATPAALGSHSSAALLPDDSALVVEGAGIQLQAFAHRSWWGPGWQDSLILGDNVPAWTGVGLQRAQSGASASPWWSWMGPWNAEFFVAQGRDPTVVADQPQGFLFAGARLTLKPHPQVEIGLARTWQTGGRGQRQGLRGLVRALLGRDTNPPGSEGVASDSGNQMAGLDLRIGCGELARCAVYTQIIGEDQARYFPTKNLFLFGAETWSAGGDHRWFVEYRNTHCHGLPWEQEQPGCAYRNHQYPQGYTNGSRWVGSSFGPDSRVVTLGWYAPADQRRVRVHIGRVGLSLGSYAPLADDPPRGPLLAVSAEQGFRLGPATLTALVNWTRLRDGTDVDANRRVGLQLGLAASWPLD